ncbi:MAG: FAD-dependent thymidylate synthase [Candidatus Micrarchaeia archaeon]
MDSKLRVYTLSGYSEELIAVAFAKTSRSPESFDKIAKELDEVKSSKFHERWVLNYGHSSVAEHAILHIAVENASRLAIDVLNSRLASYTEKSTRYQVITPDLVYIPEFEDRYREKYLETVKYLFEKYNKAIEELTRYFEKIVPEEENKKKREMEIKLKAIDNARFLLPLSTFGNIGITINARSLEHTLKKMFSHPLREVQEIAHKIKEEGKQQTPTLLKYPDKTDYLSNTPAELEKEFSSFNTSPTDYSVRLVDYEMNAEDKVLTSILYRYSKLDYPNAKEKIEKMNNFEKEKLIDLAIGGAGKFDSPVRELEHIYYTFDLVMDFGAYYEFKRHRMCTISSQKTGAEHGYYIPEEFKKAGLLELYENAMKKSDECYIYLKEKYPNEAEYISTNAHKKRVLVTMNLREVYHFIKLRGSPYAHFTIRLIAEGMQKELKRVHPLLIKHLKVRDI